MGKILAGVRWIGSKTGVAETRVGVQNLFGGKILRGVFSTLFLRVEMEVEDDTLWPLVGRADREPYRNRKPCSRWRT